MWDQTVVREEMWAHHEPRGAQYMGLNWVGPAIMAFGSDAQKQQHLSAIAAGDVIWCQGFSEPDAGSDLASLKTRATEDGDGWRINGQKIWTSYAGMAQWCVLAARVGEGERHEGITMFLVPMDTPGITVRPIKSMLGPHHLNEVFFDDVWAGPDAVLGGIGEGWAVIRRALAHERVGIARYARCERLLSALGEALAPVWDELPAGLHAQWARALIQVRVARLLAYRTVRAQETGEPPDVMASAARIAVTQCDQSVAELLFQAIEDESLEVGGERAAPRCDRGPLALRAGGDGGVGHDRSAAHDRVEGAARESARSEPRPARRRARVRRDRAQGVRRARRRRRGAPSRGRRRVPQRDSARRCAALGSTSSTHATTPTRLPPPPHCAKPTGRVALVVSRRRRRCCATAPATTCRSP